MFRFLECFGVGSNLTRICSSDQTDVCDTKPEMRNMFSNKLVVRLFASYVQPWQHMCVLVGKKTWRSL